MAVILPLSDRALANDVVADVDIRLEVLRELALVGEVRMLAVDLDDEAGLALLVDEGDRCVLPSDLLSFDGGVEEQVTGGPETRNPVRVRELEVDQVRVVADLLLLNDLEREAIFIVLLALKDLISPVVHSCTQSIEGHHEVD